MIQIHFSQDSSFTVVSVEMMLLAFYLFCGGFGADTTVLAQLIQKVSQQCSHLNHSFLSAFKCLSCLDFDLYILGKFNFCSTENILNTSPINKS